MNERSNVSFSVQSGYDVDVYGLANGTFYKIHIPAIVCITASFVCVVLAIVLSFRSKRYDRFFTNWSKSERFVVYLAICDGLFNVAHFTDHMHIVIVRNHVYPKELCEFYGFTLAMFITAQHLLVNAIAINVFMLIYFDKKLNFGVRDWRLLSGTFGVPFIGAASASIAGQMGPNGTFCFFDAVKGKLANIFFTTVPLLVIAAVNILMYVLTWKRIRDQTKAIRKTMTSMTANMRASHRAARIMSLFVIAFFIQWWAMAFYGVWVLIDEDIPQPVFHLVTTFSNIGGCLNLFVFLIMKRKQLYLGRNQLSRIKATENPGSKRKRDDEKSNIASADDPI